MGMSGLQSLKIVFFYSMRFLHFCIVGRNTPTPQRLESPSSDAHPVKLLLMNRTTFYLLLIALVGLLPRQASSQCVAELQIVQSFCSNSVGGVELLVVVERPSQEATGWSLGDATVLYPFDTIVSLGPFFGSLIVLEPLILGVNCQANPFTFVNQCNNNSCPLALFVADTTMADCGASNGSITFEVVNASPPYQIFWAGGGQSGSVTDTNFIGGLAGNTVYFFELVDATDFCTASEQYYLPSRNAPTVFANSIEPARCGIGGTISLTVQGGTGDHTYLWSDGSTNLNREDLAPGLYTLVVTDAAGCEASASYTVEEFNEVFLFTNPVSPRICDGQTIEITAFEEASFNLGAVGTFQWLDPDLNLISHEATVSVSAPGTYRVYWEYGNCSETLEVVVRDGSATGEIIFNSFENDSLGCISNMYFQINGNWMPANWTLPNGSQLFAQAVDVAQYGPGLYIAQVNATNAACPFIDSLLVLPEDIRCGNLNGLVYLDVSLDCSQQANEPGLGGQLLRIRGVDVPEREYFAYTSFGQSNTGAAVGTWSASLPAGQYTVELLSPNELYEACMNNLVYAVQPNLPTASIPLGLRPLPELACPQVTVDVNVPLIRRCFNSPVWVRYENTGSAVAENTVITVEVADFADGVFSFNGQNPTTINQDPTTGIFTLSWVIGDLSPFAGGLLSFMVYTCNADAPLGAAACITATAQPNNPCPPADPAWTGASVRVEGSCQGDSVVFRLRNVGNAEMSINLSYIVVEDGVVITPVPSTSDPLAALQAVEVSLPANGSTYHLRAMQEPLHPGLLMPIDFVEGCGSTPNDQSSLGFALQFPVSDDAYWIDTDCQAIIGAYDPNDKLAEPRGYAEENFIEADQPIDYTIRFQNTGTDTAFLVVIRDTLSPLLDLSTLQVLSTTHSMELKIDTSNALAFIFEEILLVDSFTNEPGSHGAVSFRIHPKAGLAPGTQLENTAHIYFDFNEAVVTNTYRHTIGSDFVVVGLFDFQPSVENIHVYPNPTQGPARLILPAALQNEQLAVEVIDALGRPQSQYQYSQGQDATLDISHLPAGLYTLRLSKNGQALGVGRLLLQSPQ